MALKDELHPMWARAVRGLSRPDASANTTFIDSLQKNLDESEKAMYEAKLEAFLDTAEGKWLDYWGQWLGLHRDGRDDIRYRNALKHHVLHKRNTISALREAIADYLKTNIDNIYIYEPFRDMFVYNSSKWNSYKFYPSTYYRYAVIDVEIDSPFTKTINDIINLFRPAGVYWVVTSLINVLNLNAPIVDFTTNTSYPFLSYIIDYVGFMKRDTHHIVPNFSRNFDIDNPFIWNNSLLNGGRVYYMIQSAINGIATLGQSYNELEPDEHADRVTAFSYVQPLEYSESSLLSKADGRGVTYHFKPNNKNIAKAINKTGHDAYQFVVDNTYTPTDNDNLFLYGQQDAQQFSSFVQWKMYVPKGNYDFTLSYDEVPFDAKIRVEVMDGDTVAKTFESAVQPAGSNKRVTVNVDLSDGNHTIVIQPVVSDNGITNSYRISKGTLKKHSDISTLYTTPKAYLVGLKTEVEAEVTMNILNPKTGFNYEFMDSYNESNLKNAGTWHIFRIPMNYNQNLTFDCIGNEITSATVVPYTEQGVLYPLPFKGEESQQAPLIGVIDFYDYYDTGELRGTNHKEDVLNAVDDYSIKNLTFRIKNELKGTQTVTGCVYNFELKSWVNLGHFQVTDQYQTFKLSFLTLKSYLNNEGILFTKLIPEDATKAIVVDYFGFSYGKNTVDIFSPNINQNGLGVWLQSLAENAVYARVSQAKVNKDSLVTGGTGIKLNQVKSYQTPVILSKNDILKLNFDTNNLHSGDTLIFQLDTKQKLVDVTGLLKLNQQTVGNMANVVDNNSITFNNLTTVPNQLELYNDSNQNYQIQGFSIINVSNFYDHHGENLWYDTDDWGDLTSADTGDFDFDTNYANNRRLGSAVMTFSTKDVKANNKATLTLKNVTDIRTTDPYTVSVELKGNGVLSQLGYTNSQKKTDYDRPLNADFWQRYEFTSVKRNQQGQFVIGITSNSNDPTYIEITKPKLEIGQTSTHYNNNATGGTVTPPDIKPTNTVTVKYVFYDNKTGNTLNTITRTGKSGDSIGYTTTDEIENWLGKNYKLISDDTKGQNLNYPDTDKTYYIYFDHATTTTNIAKSISRTIKYLYDGEQMAHQPTVQTKIFTHTVTTDLVTNTNTRDIWAPSYAQFDAVTAPTIDGYTPDQATIPSLTITHDSTDVTSQVIYKKVANTETTLFSNTALTQFGGGSYGFSLPAHNGKPVTIHVELTVTNAHNNQITTVSLVDKNNNSKVSSQSQTSANYGFDIILMDFKIAADDTTDYSNLIVSMSSSDALRSVIIRATIYN